MEYFAYILFFIFIFGIAILLLFAPSSPFNIRYDVLVDGVLYEDVKYHVDGNCVSICDPEEDYPTYYTFETFEVIGKHTEE